MEEGKKNRSAPPAGFFFSFPQKSEHSPPAPRLGTLIFFFSILSSMHEGADDIEQRKKRN